MGDEHNKEIAMKLNLGDLFYKHMDRMSETSSKISDESGSQATNFKMEVLLLEATLWPYITTAKQEKYYEKVEGWADLKKERVNLENKLTASKLGEDGVSNQKMALDVKEALLKLRGLMSFAVSQNIAPGYKPAEKKFGVTPKTVGKAV